MLHDILNGQEKSKFILITDEVESCGRSLLLNFMLELLQRQSHVIITCLERPPRFFKSFLPHDVQHKVKYVQPSPPCQDEGDDVFHNITTIVNSFANVQQCVAVVVDSLSTPLFETNTPSVCQAVHKLCGASPVSQVIALLHRDVHDESTHRLLTHQASSVLELTPASQPSCQVCHVRHCRPTGKVMKSAESFRIDDSFLIQDVQPLKKMDTSRLEPSHEPDKTDPTSDLTFNLSLTSSEKEARSQVVLPYLKDRSKPEESPASQGRIYYQADDADDLDEEDPDDDLNI